MNRKPSLRISFNAPVVLGFALLCLIAQLLRLATGGATDRLLFSVYRASPMNPLSYLRLIGHVFGHAGWEHLSGNLMFILLLGPMLEEKYGSSNLLFVMLATALVTSLVNVIFFPRVALMGASGIVFAFILLSSITVTDDNSIPITFILVALMYLGRQLYQSLFVSDNISQLSHILGGLVGSALGFIMNRGRMTKYHQR